MYLGTSVSKELVQSKKVDSDFGTDFILSFTNVGSERLVCLHGVDNGVISKAKPVDKSGLLTIVNEVCADITPEYWRDPRVLYKSSNVMVWYRKASKVAEKIWFRVGERHIEARVKLPTLVFIEVNGSLKIFAACSKVISNKTKLYHAPLCNIGTNGCFCFGTATKPPAGASIEVKIAGYEEALLGSNFTHISCSKTFNALLKGENTTDGHIKMWKQFEATGKAPNRKDLIPFGKTLVKLVEELEKRA